jgi:hypothetical protein
VHRAHPDDPDADGVERACWERALGLLRGGTAAAAPTRAPRPRADWKEQAARMEFA